MSVQSEIERIKAGKEDIRAAIVAKGQSVPATALLSSYGDKIRAIQTGTDTSDATAAAGDILSGKTAYVKGNKITGTIAGKTASNLTASGATVTVPAGYYPSQVSKSISTATQATPSISVSSGGLITAGATQAAGYVASGTKSATKQLATQAAQTITPGTADKTIASGQYLTGAQTIKGDANLLAENIKEGVSIFGVEGALEGAETVTVSLRSEPKYGKVNYYYLVNGQLESLLYPSGGNDVVSKTAVLQLPALIVATMVGSYTLFTTSSNVTQLDISSLNMALFTIKEAGSGQTSIRAWG